MDISTFHIKWKPDQKQVSNILGENYLYQNNSAHHLMICKQIQAPNVNVTHSNNEMQRERPDAWQVSERTKSSFQKKKSQ